MPQGFCGSGQQTPHSFSQRFGDFTETDPVLRHPSDLPPLLPPAPSVVDNDMFLRVIAGLMAASLTNT